MSDTLVELNSWLGNLCARAGNEIPRYAFTSTSRYWQRKALPRCRSTRSVRSEVEVHTLADLGVTSSPLHNPDSLAE